MINNAKYYPYGYIFSDEELSNIPDYYEKVLINRYYYYHDKNIDISIFEDDNKFIIIHGEFVHVGINDQMSKKEVTETLFNLYQEDYLQFLNLLDFIAGRFVIIIGDDNKVLVYPDATNTRSTYYSENKNILASHVFLIRDQLVYNRVAFSKALPDLTNGLISTPFNQIKSVVPNYSLELFSKKYKRFFPRENNKYTKLSEEEKFSLFERFWKKQLDFYLKKYKNFIFSITGGGDSRFSLALIKEHINEIQFFTYATKEGIDNSSYAGKLLTLDYKIVKQMLNDINLNHKFIYFVDDKKQLSNEELNLLNKNTIGRHSSFLIPHIKENYNQENLKHIRGNLLEIGKTRYFNKQYKESNINEVKKIFDSQYRKAKDDKYNALADEMFADYIDRLNYGVNIYDYHILDLYHWEVRMGRWHPEILNTHDIIFDTISPFNHRAMIEVSLSFSYEKRRDEYLFKELINRNYSILNFYGDNTLKNLYEQKRDEKYEK
ncbi:hypothetical protein [Salinicoccus carnicancri]|uniref:hypothetical protein n=1 Tax=Salinicoccus carnicancri TaxID=558170 RepID=UPI0002D3D7C3|nr:hypothetical protein [Salinicoccus carnicancri]